MHGMCEMSAIALISHIKLCYTYWVLLLFRKFYIVKIMVFPR